MDQHTLVVLWRSLFLKNNYLKAVPRTYKSVMCWGVMFKDIFNIVASTWGLVDVEVTLLYSICDQYPHVDSFTSILFDRIICDTHGALIVGLDRGRWLGVLHLDKSFVDGSSFLDIEE